ncbi:MAG: Chromosome partition protein Smc [Candidatus Heimdallarchaeota archaeon LC_2]|nr:MAG: Chromosome partition protein Smc [Candidatus Heimdallarchaeota archaeon LC_2]
MSIDDNIDKISKEMEMLADEVKTHQEMLGKMIESMISAVYSSNTEIEELKTKSSALENEQKLLNTEIETSKRKNSELNSEKERLTSQIKLTKEEINRLTNENTKYGDEINLITGKNKSNTDQFNSLEIELTQKIISREEIEASIEVRVQSNIDQLNAEKEKLKSVIDEYFIWDYLKSKIEAPEIEIIAIIARKRNISSDEIKEAATTISPVFVNRSISKLDADGKIVQNDEGKWDIASSLLSTLDI